MTFTFHPITEVFPLLNDTELRQLADDIKANGLHEPIWIYDGKILDGRNRARACELAGVDLKTRTFQGTLIEALAFVWGENFHRRHLNSSQQAMAEAKRAQLQDGYLEALKEDAAKRQIDAGEYGKEGGRGKKKEKEKEKTLREFVPQGFVPHEQRRTRSVRAKSSNTNPKYIDFADKLLKDDPETAEAVLRGDKKLTQVKREQTRERLKEKAAALPEGTFRIVYADPPWKYGNAGIIGETDNYGHTARHYSSMSIEELCTLDVKSVLADDAVLFLWVTSPLLAECWPVIKAWGFSYRSSFVWDKVRHNFGHYNSVRHEFLLICTRGSCLPDAKTLHDSVVAVKRSSKHSEKPEDFRQLIDLMYTHGPRLELFARGEHEGWTCWGNEIQ